MKYWVEKVLSNFGECALEKVQISTFVHNSIKYRQVVKMFWHERKDRQINVIIHFFCHNKSKEHAKPKR
jgi:hypothetical protein